MTGVGYKSSCQFVCAITPLSNTKNDKQEKQEYLLSFFPIGFVATTRTTVATANQQVMPDDHSELVPPLPIPNRTVKRLCANDSAATSVKVGYRQAVIPENPRQEIGGGFCFGVSELKRKIEINHPVFKNS